MIRRLSIEILERLSRRFERLYGEEAADRCLRRLAMMVGRYGVGEYGREAYSYWDQADSVLITYADSLRNDGRKHLSVLHHFLHEYLRGTVSTVHLLPFFPYSSDDGFSVVDYLHVREDCGDWEHVERIGREFNLMFDLVLNHVSAESEWHKDFILGVAPARHYFIEADPSFDWSGVVRPRPTPLLKKTPTRQGEKHLWTTFSADQVDLNFAHPDVLFEFLDILLFYISKGARIIRLDAIAYLWKKAGTPCIHLSETHEVVKIIRDVIDMVAPSVKILTETNVPHEENVSYFGAGDEAHMVYQFSLPPLVLYALAMEDAGPLTRWASHLPPPPEGCTYLNFTASHDGIGVRPLEGRLEADGLDRLIEHVKARGGRVSTKRNADGSESPYELNISYFDALGDGTDEVTPGQIERFLCSQTIALEMQGLPAVYIQSLLGARNDDEGLARTGRARSINRKSWEWSDLRAHLEDRQHPMSKVFREYRRRLMVRAKNDAFHPSASQEILDMGADRFVVHRKNERSGQNVLCVSNVTSHPVTIDVTACLGGSIMAENLLTGKTLKVDKPLKIAPWKTLWLDPGVVQED